MKTVDEFQNTQNLINEYNELESKIPTLETKMEANRIKAEDRIERLQEEMKPNEEDIEFNINRDKVVKEYQGKIDDIKTKLEEDNKLLTDEIEESKNAKKYFATDKHFKTITTEIEEMKEEILKGKRDLKKKDIELEEFYAEENHEDPLRWQKIYKEQDELRKNISELEAKVKEYSNFKDDLYRSLTELNPTELEKLANLEKEESEKPADPEEGKDPKETKSSNDEKAKRLKSKENAEPETIKKGVLYEYEIEGEDEGEKPKASKGKDVANISEGQRGSDGGKGTKPEEQKGSDNGKGTKPEGQKDSDNGKGPGEPTTPESGRIELIKFEIYKTLPSYLIITADGKEERFYPIDKKDKKYIEEDVYKRLRGKDKKLLQEKFGNMQDIEKVFDRGLENVLMQFDTAHGIARDAKASQTARFYQMFNDMSDSGKMKDPLNISYNLSELHSADMNRSDKRALKRMVRNLDKHNMAWYIAKPKNFFARLFGGVKLLGDGKENAKNIEETAREETVTEQIKKMTPQEVAEIYKNVSKESSFNEKIFWEQMGLSDEEIKAVKDELAKENPCKKFREDMRKTAEKPEERHNVVLTEDMKKAIKRDYTDLYDTPGFSDTEFAKKYGITNEQLADIRDIVIAEKTARFVAKSQAEDKKQKAEAAAKTEKGTVQETTGTAPETPQGGEGWEHMSMREINDALINIGLDEAASIGNESEVGERVEETVVTDNTEASTSTEKLGVGTTGTAPETPEEMADRILRENPKAGQGWEHKNIEEINAELEAIGLYNDADAGKAAEDVGREPDDER